jgi:putative endonuclease
MSPAARRRAFRRGHSAELLCLWHLRLRCCRILARRFRVKSGEIDLIARRGRAVAAIEVKARDSIAVANASFSHQQRRRIARALAHFVATRPALVGLTLRFDVMLVAPGRLAQHIIDAWQAEP